MRVVIAAISVVLALCSNASAAHRFHHYRHHGGGYSVNLDSSCRSVRPVMGGPCGCWAAEHFFGSPPVQPYGGKNLWLVANWLRVFPMRTQAAAGTAAVWPNRHHVAPVIAVNGNGTVTVHDSWGDHAVRMAGLTFVNPRGGNYEAPVYASRVHYARLERRPARQEAYLRRHHYAGVEVWRQEYH